MATYLNIHSIYDSHTISPVTESKTGRQNYSSGPLYSEPFANDPSPTSANPTNPEPKPRRSKNTAKGKGPQQQQPTVEMSTYPDPATIQHTPANTTDDLYAKPDIPKKVFH